MKWVIGIKRGSPYNWHIWQLKQTSEMHKQYTHYLLHDSVYIKKFKATLYRHGKKS